MVTVRSVLMGLAVASVCGVDAWLALAKGHTIAPAIDAGSSTAAPTAVASPADVDVAPHGQPGRELAPTHELASRSAGESVDEDLHRELETLCLLEDAKSYELLRQRFAVDPKGTARLCQVALAELIGVEAKVILVDEAFLGATFAAWLDTANSPTDVLAAVLAMVPDDYLRGGPIVPIARSLAKRSEHLPPQPDGQQRALVHALVAAADHHGQRQGHGILVARALGLAIDHDPMTQAALTRLARSPHQRVREVAWDELAEELPPAALLALIDEPLPQPPVEHDAKRVLAALRSIRNAPDQSDVVHRWLGAQFLELARQCQTTDDPQHDRTCVQWLGFVVEDMSDDARNALQPELKVLAVGQGKVAQFARSALLPPR